MRNPYAKSPPVGAPAIVQNNEIMGRQSQQRVSNTKRAYQLACYSSSKKKKKGDQLTLQGDRAFEAEKDCQICRAQSLARTFQGVRIPKRSHHELCIKNTTTKGRGRISQQNMATSAEEKRLKTVFETPLAQHEKASGKHTTAAGVAAFFAPSKTTINKSQNWNPKEEPQKQPQQHDFCQAVTGMVTNDSFKKKHASKNAPLAMIAFATDLLEQQMSARSTGSSSFAQLFDGLTALVPESPDSHNSPHYHSIVGQKLLLVDWSRAFGINPACPDAACGGILRNTRTNFSKNKTLFPIFSLTGAPSWCVVMKLSCTCCQRVFDANDAEVLLSLPAHIASHYPVATEYALSNHSFHIDKHATTVFDSIMLRS